MNRRRIGHALRTALRVMRFDAAAIENFDQSYEGFFHSFWGMALALPVQVLSIYAAATINGGAAAAADAASGAQYGVGLAELGAIWLIYVGLMIPVVRFVGAGDRYVPYIIAFNWCTPILLTLTVAPAAMVLLGVTSLGAAGLVQLVAIVYALVVYWFIARHGLRTTALTSVAFVLILLIVLALDSALTGGAA